jgi:UDP-glucose:(heptosyl)LPS alpha-1,3-glucosyltransferase
VALSQSVADDFQRIHHVAPERIRIVYNGVDTDHFSPQRCAAVREAVRRSLHVEESTILLLIVAHNFQVKGLATLLGTLGRLLAQGLPVRLAVVGGKRLHRWQRMARRLGVAAATDFIGPVEDTLPYYAAADLYVHPTIYDTCSLVVLEAAACGLPIITTRCNGAAELLHDGQDALLVSDPGDVEALAQRVRTLVDPAARQSLGRAARQTAVKHTFDTNVDRVLAVYEESMEKRRQCGGRPTVWSGRVTAAESDPAAGGLRCGQRGQFLESRGVLQ